MVRILLVEDNVLLADAMRDHLMAAGHDIDWAVDLRSAISASDRIRYDLVLLDLRLPDGSGLELLRHLGCRQRMVPVIVLSAYDQISDRMEALEIGGLDYLVKPFNLSELVFRVRRIAASSGAAADGQRAERCARTLISNVARRPDRLLH